MTVGVRLAALTPAHNHEILELKLYIEKEVKPLKKTGVCGDIYNWYSSIYIFRDADE